MVAWELQSARADLLIFSHQNAFRYDESGKLLSQMPRNYNVESIDAVAVGLDGNVHGLGNSLGSASVLRFDRITGAFKDVLVPERGGLSVPRMMAIGQDGDIYVSARDYVGGPTPDNEYIRVTQFDGATGALKKTLISVDDRVRGSGAIAIGLDGRLYLADSRGIVRYNTATGALVDVFSAVRPELAVAQTIFFGKNGSLYVVGYDSVYRVDGITGEFAGKFIDAGAQLSPTATAGPDGDIYLRLGYTRSIWRFDGTTGLSKGVFIRGIGTSPYDDSISALTFFGPRLSVAGNAGGGLQIRWNGAFRDFGVEASDDVGSLWEDLPGTPATTGNELQLNMAVSSQNRLFRLVKH